MDLNERLSLMMDEPEAQPLVPAEPQPVTDPKSFWEKYQVLGKLGQGGEGHVHKVRDITTGQLYAAKVLNFHNLDDWSDISRMRKEVEVLQTLDHPGVPKYVDSYLDEEDGKWGKDVEFIVVSELARGNPLSASMSSLPMEEMEGIHDKVLEILSYIHSQGVIHRDIKLDNIIYDSESGEVSLIDFGISKIMGQTTGITNVGLMGTITHMAPEMLREGEITAAVDLYGLGVSMIELAQRKQFTELPQSLEKKLSQLKQLSSGYRERLKRLVDEDPGKRVVKDKDTGSSVNAGGNLGIMVAGGLVGCVLGMTAGIFGVGFCIDYIQEAIGYSGIGVYVGGYIAGGIGGGGLGTLLGVIAAEDLTTKEIDIPDKWYSNLETCGVVRVLEEIDNEWKPGFLSGYVLPALVHPDSKVRRQAVEIAQRRDRGYELAAVIREMEKDPSWKVRRAVRKFQGDNAYALKRGDANWPLPGSGYRKKVKAYLEQYNQEKVR